MLPCNLQLAVLLNIYDIFYRDKIKYNFRNDSAYERTRPVDFSPLTGR